MPELGTDCDLTLTHPLVNQGLPSGFLLDPDPAPDGKAIRIVREACSDGTRVTVRFELLLADRQLNPDGSTTTSTRAERYALLLAYLQQQTDIQVDCALGSLVNLGALGYAASERHGVSRTVVRVSLSNAGIYYPPVPSELLNQSLWDGLMRWQQAYWR